MLEQSHLKAYTIENHTQLKELNAIGYILRHKKTGARVVAVSCEDENKVFTIGFKTPPKDDTGIAHIMEHSTLCGSSKYPAKDPFVELAKGSLNTFLNAMTYSDKTVYPIASCNLKDFENLMDVYLDAVFHPNIYDRPQIMKQEGWHYDIESVDGELKYNGVVYNEMKGVYSAPDQLLFRYIQAALLPDTTYVCESGGDPEYIVDLTREDFLKFHDTYYHPSNSYIYLYGDMDMERELDYIDREYLSHYDYKEVDAHIDLQQPFEQMRMVEKAYPISDEEPEENQTYLSYNVVVENSLDRELYLAFQILDYVLIDAPGAKLKKAMIDAGVGKDFVSSYDNGINQPIYSLISKGANVSDREKFVTVLEDTLSRITEQGIDKKALEAAMNRFEFKYREASFGSYPKGLMYGLKMFDSWLYDDAKPFIHVQTNELFTVLREKMEQGYFEDLIRKYLLDNTHKVLLTMKPQKGLNRQMEEAVRQKLADYKAKLSKEELEALITDKKALVEYQMTPSTKEELETIPLLNLSDIDKHVKPFNNQNYEVAGTPVVGHHFFTNEIAYLTFVFRMPDVAESLYPYASLLTDIFGYVDTDRYTYSELSNEIDLHAGAFAYSLHGVSQYDAKRYVPGFSVSFKCFYHKINKAFELMEEILFHSHIEDEKRLREIIAEVRMNCKEMMAKSGHTVASTRAQSYISSSARFQDMTQGLGYYDFVADLDDHFEERKDKLVDTLKLVLGEILRKDSLIVSYTGDQDVEKTLAEPLSHLTSRLSTRTLHDAGEETPYEIKNEGIRIAGKVQYVATAGNFKQAGYEYTGALQVLRVIFSYDYLWLNIRVKGGAYGAMCGFSRNGYGTFMSYRDPNLLETYEVYQHAAEYVKHFDVDERDMTKYIIGAIAKMDTPLEPQTEGLTSFFAQLTGVTDEMRQRDRDEILGATTASIRALAPIVDAIGNSGIICAVGNETKLAEHKEMFHTLRNGF